MQDKNEKNRNGKPQKKSWLTRNVLMLGVISLLTDTASEMVMPLLPMFLTQVLSAGALTLGWIEGLADFVASFLKLFSGRWADRMKKNRPLVIVGYTLASVVRPLVAFATHATQVMAVRVVDRIGKGLRTSPRDAMIAASVPAARRATAFGFHRAMDHMGAVIGPLLAVICLSVWPNGFRTIFLLAAIPGALVIVVVFFGLRETHLPEAPTPVILAPSKPRIPVAHRRQLIRFLVPLAIFTLGNSSDLFLLLKAGDVDTPLMGLPLLWMGFHLVKATSSFGGGWLADRLGRPRVIVMGWLFYAAVYAAFAFVDSPRVVVLLFLIYGLYYGLTEGAEKALVLDLAPKESQATALGWYHWTVGVLTLPASVLFGLLWELFGNVVPFVCGAGLALVGTLVLLVGMPKTPENSSAPCS